MNRKMTVTLDGDPVLEYDRDKPLPGQQVAYLESMDESMSRGIDLGGERVENPDEDQRLEFVAGFLYHALVTDQDSAIAAMCAYIATHREDVTEVRFEQHGDSVSIEMLVGGDHIQRMDGIPVTLQ